MIDRYTTAEASAIWSRKAKYERWKQVELAVCEVYFEQGKLTEKEWEAIRSRAHFSLERCDEIEQETRHDLMAFVRNLSESIGEEARWVHFGLTSYDVIDTALGMLLRDSCALLIEATSELDDAIRKLADEHIDTPMIGRTHGIHAEPITFGFKLNGWRHELNRHLIRLEAVKHDVSVGKISGAVGVHAHVEPKTERRILEKLGLRPDGASTQIVSRDRHAAFTSELALLGSSLERFSTELRNLQRTEILEVQEAFAVGQTGSSAMPHKRNPWSSETVGGLARVLRGNASAMLESVSTWHERDLTNSSVERIVLPDSVHLAHFMLKRLTLILSGLIVFPDRMLSNLRLMGDLVFSEHLMLALIEKGIRREDAYKLAQRLAAESWEGKDFKTSVSQDPEVMNLLTPEQIETLFSLAHHLRNAKSSHPGSEA